MPDEAVQSETEVDDTETTIKRSSPSYQFFIDLKDNFSVESFSEDYSKNDFFCPELVISFEYFDYFKYFI